MDKKSTQKPPQKAESAEKTTPKKSGKKILIVEDERPLAHALELKFNHEGYSVVVAADGEEALKVAKEETFDVVLLDLIMPKMDGFAFLEGINAKNKGSKVIILSNLGQDEDRERAEALGAIAYYVKSNTPITDIVEKVKGVLH